MRRIPRLWRGSMSKAIDAWGLRPNSSNDSR